jgi:hypothetical protein
LKQFNVLIIFILLLLLSFPNAIKAQTLNDNVKKEDSVKKKNKKNKKPKVEKCIGLVNMSNGIVLPKGKVIANVKYKYIHKGSLYDGSTEKNGNYGGKYDRVNQLVQFTARAGLFKNFDARILVPVWKKQIKRKPGNLAQPYDKDTNSGLGDITIMGRYALLTQRDGDWLNLAIGAGIKTPTGDSDRENEAPFSNMYKYLGPRAQLGTGSWDPKFEIGATKFFGRSRVDAHMMYTLGGDGAHNSRPGNQFKYDIGYGYALNHYFDLELELNGIEQDSDVHDGTVDRSTGGHTIFITPGIHFKYEKINFSVGVPVVIYRDLNGYSRTPERNSRYGLGEDFQVVSKLGFCF